MPLPEFTKKLIEAKFDKYCDRRIPIHVRDQVKLIYKIIGNKVTLIETRPYHLNPSIWTETPIAHFRFDNNKQWLLYSINRNDRWHLYDLIPPRTDFDDLLKEVDRAPTRVFWG